MCRRRGEARTMLVCHRIFTVVSFEKLHSPKMNFFGRERVLLRAAVVQWTLCLCWSQLPPSLTADGASEERRDALPPSVHRPVFAAGLQLNLNEIIR